MYVHMWTKKKKLKFAFCQVRKGLKKGMLARLRFLKIAYR